MSRTYFDAHCHLFNGRYALTEAIAISWNWVWGNYPHKKTAPIRTSMISPVEKPSIDGWEELMKYIARLLTTICRSCEEIYNYENRCFAESQISPETSLIMSPLMMDIYYMFDNGETDIISELSHERTALPSDISFTEETITPKLEKRFQEHLAWIKSCVEKYLPEKSKTIAIHDSDKISANIILDDMLKEIGDEYHHKKVTRTGTRSGVYSQTEMSKGFTRHMNELTALKAKYPKMVYPFLAVDPRRIGIMNIVKNVGKDMTFNGIKLYPPLGYLPTHPNLYAVYDYCVDDNNNIPITIHTSDGGFPTQLKKIYVRSTTYQEGAKWEYFSDITASKYFANPDNWKPILENKNGKYKNLRLNFAHFGGEKQLLEYATNPQANNWTGKIIDLMNKYPNIYADIAYCPSENVLQAINTITQKESIVKERLMFGTDFIMIMLDSQLGGLGKYFQHYANLSTAMFIDNPKRFLLM